MSICYLTPCEPWKEDNSRQFNDLTKGNKSFLRGPYLPLSSSRTRSTRIIYEAMYLILMNLIILFMLRLTTNDLRTSWPYKTFYQL